MIYGTQAAGLIGVVLLAGVLVSAGAPAHAQEAASPEAAPTSAPAATEETTTAAEELESLETGAGPEPAAEEAPAAEASPPPAPKPTGPLVVVSWGGAYSQSQEEAVYRPFTRATGIQVDSKTYGGGLDLLRAQAAAGDTTWDVVDVNPADAAEGCAEGLFQKLNFVLPAAPDGTPASEDFLPGTLRSCAVGSVAWSMVLAYSTNPEGIRADETPPASLEDFFDLERFPGRRGLRRSPMTNLEWALLADGVPVGAVYDVLATRQGVDRAFAKLDSIRDEIVWWEDAGEPGRLLANDAVVMTSTYNAPAFIDIVVRQQPFNLLWDRQVWDVDYWAIPAGAPNREAAREFLRFATDSGPLARQTRWIPYGPVRRSAITNTGAYLYADIEMAPFLPTTQENLATALRNDALFWRDHGPALVERFNRWLGH